MCARGGGGQEGGSTLVQRTALTLLTHPPTHPSTPPPTPCQFFLFNFVEIKRWEDLKKPGSQGELGSFVGLEGAFKGTGTTGYPGGFFDPLGLGSGSASSVADYRLKEIKNGGWVGGRLEGLRGVQRASLLPRASPTLPPHPPSPTPRPPPLSRPPCHAGLPGLLQPVCGHRQGPPAEPGRPRRRPLVSARAGGAGGGGGAPRLLLVRAKARPLCPSPPDCPLPPSPPSCRCDARRGSNFASNGVSLPVSIF